jgi:hypothetical protein
MAEFDIGKPREAAPNDAVAWRRVTGPRQVAAQSSKFGEVEGECSRSAWAIASVTDKFVKQSDFSVGEG